MNMIIEMPCTIKNVVIAKSGKSASVVVEQSIGQYFGYINTYVREDLVPTIESYLGKNVKALFGLYLGTSKEGKQYTSLQDIRALEVIEG